MIKTLFLLLLTKVFLITLENDEYQIFIRQRYLIAPYEKLISHILMVPLNDLSTNSALCFAQALYKGANMYRCTATEESLKLALSYHQKALEWRIQCLDPRALELAHSYADLGATYNELKGTDNNIQAIELYKKALTIYEYHNEKCKPYVASTFNKLANAYRDLSDANIPLAINYLNRALDIFATVPNDAYCQLEQAKIFYNQGVNYHRLGGEENTKRAIQFLHKAKNFFESNNDTARYTITMNYLNNVYSNKIL